MFKKDDSPISLFSFQDIITSLIGIMLLILLIMCIQLLSKVETKETTENRKEDLEQLQQEKQKALQQKNMILRQVRASHDANLRYTHITPYEIRKKTKELTELLNQAKQKKQEKQKEQARLETQYQTVEAEKKKQEKQASLDKDRKEIQRIKKNLKQLDQTKNKLKNRIASQKKIKITVSEETNLTPLVITISGKSIIAKQLSAQKVLFRIQNRNITESHINELVNKLKPYTWKKYHFIFLVKPSAAEVSAYLGSKFSNKYPKEPYGIEPIYEDEEVE